MRLLIKHNLASKGKRVCGYLFVVGLLAAVVFFLFAKTNQQKGRCNRIKTDSSYQMDFASWSGTEEYTLHLETGDALHIEWNLQVGEIDVMIAIPGLKAVYEADGVAAEDNPRAEFDVSISEAGDYRISISAKKAAGMISLSQVFTEALQ